jgi:6-phosphofructokinase 1
VGLGSGQHLIHGSAGAYDASGNRLQHDIGVFLKDEITRYFKALREPVNIRYIDPSYIIRSVPANSDDRLLCDQLARHAVHAAMAGKTDVLVCYKNAKFMHVPIPMASSQKQRVDPRGELWAAVLASTGQPAQFPGDTE